MTTEFDVFLSYNRNDRPQVVKLRERLRERELTVWLDQDELPPGRPWQGELERQVRSARAVAVCIGLSGISGWQLEEVELALRTARAIDRPVVPVLLPNAPDDVLIPEALDLRTRVDFREGGFSDDALSRLVWGITGVRPLRSPRRNDNLPRTGSFFGRATELAQLADALRPDVRAWGALVDGPGGIGKTALAIRAAEQAADRFDRIAFVTAKVRELLPEGTRLVDDSVAPVYVAMLRELAIALGITVDVERTPDRDLKVWIADALSRSSTLIVFDNVESLPEEERLSLYHFLERLPNWSKAIVTSRRRNDLGVRTIRLERLDSESAHKLIYALAADRPALRNASEHERMRLVEETGGNPLVIRWLAGQLGRGACHSAKAALELLGRPNSDNDPLDFIFGDLARGLLPTELKMVCALTHFVHPLEVRQASELIGVSRQVGSNALEALAFRALANTDAESRSFTLAPMVGTYLRRARPAAVHDAAARLEAKALAVVTVNGGERYDRFQNIEREWVQVEAAIPLFVGGDNARLQRVCDSLDTFLDFTGRWDRWFRLSVAAEKRAEAANDPLNAGMRAYMAGWSRIRAADGPAVLDAATRASRHWAGGTPTQRAKALKLEGQGHQLLRNYANAARCYGEAFAELKSADPRPEDLVDLLLDLGAVDLLVGSREEAEQRYKDALRLARTAGYREGIASVTGHLAMVALDREDWKAAERLARDAHTLAENLGRRELVGWNCLRIAVALLGQRRVTEARPFADRAVLIFRELGRPDLPYAQQVLSLCVKVP